MYIGLIYAYFRSSTIGWTDQQKPSKHRPTLIDTLLDLHKEEEDSRTCHSKTSHGSHVSVTSQPKQIMQIGGGGVYSHSLHSVKTAVVRPRVQHAKSFDDFRSDRDTVTSSNTSQQQQQQQQQHVDEKKERQRPLPTRPVTRQTSAKHRAPPSRSKAELQHSRLRRTKSAENRLSSDVTRSQSPSTWSASRASNLSVVTSASSGSAYVSGLMMKMAPQKDREYSRVLHIGDRVYVDMSRSKGDHTTSLFTKYQLQS